MAHQAQWKLTDFIVAQSRGPSLALAQIQTLLAAGVYAPHGAGMTFTFRQREVRLLRGGAEGAWTGAS